MMARKRFSGAGFKIFALIMTLLIVSNCLSAAEQEGISEQSPYEIFPLKNISFEQGKKYLAELGFGAISRFPGSNAILVTAQSDELAKARAVLGLVDGTETCVIRLLEPPSTFLNVPSNEQIAAKVGNITIGTFADPPTRRKGTKAIIDVHNGSLVVVAPFVLSEAIVSVINQKSDSYIHSNMENQYESLSSRKEINNLRSMNMAIDSDQRELSDLVVTDESGYMNRESVKTLPSLLAAVEQETLTGEDDSAQTIEELFTVNQMEEQPNIENGDQVVNLALGEYERLSIVEFLGLVGPYLQLDFMYDEQVVAGEVTFNPHGKFRGPIKIKDLYILLETVLKFKNLAMTRGEGNLVTIAPMANAFDIDPTLLEEGVTQIGRGDGIVTRIIELKHISPSNAITLINAMKLSVTPPISEGKSLIVTTYSHRIPRLERILNMIDKPGEPRKFRYRQLRYTMAQTLAPKLQTLAEQLGTVSITISAEDEPTTTTTPSPRRSNETAAQYAARLRREQTLRTQRAQAAQPAAAEEQVQPSVFLDADERTNRILMIGDQEQLDAVEDLIETLDVAQQDLRSLKLYRIENVDAEEVRDKLVEFGIIGASSQQQGASSMDETTSEPTATPAQQRTPAARRRTTTRTGTEEQLKEALVEEPQVVVIEQTNSLLVNATQEQHERIETIKNYIDSQLIQDEIPYKVYQLKNQGPEHLREILLPLIEETIEAVRDEQDKIQETRKKQEDPITIVADPNTFSLVVYANKKNQDWIESLVTQLDKRRPQVLIDVTLVQIQKTDSFEYDLNLIESFPDLTHTSGLTSAIMGVVDAASGEVVKDNFHPVSNLTNSGRDRFADFQSNNGRVAAFYGDKHINFLLTAMQKKDYGRVLAKPKILVNDNEQGVISTIRKTYVEKSTGTIIEGVGNAVSTSLDYQDYPTGITLTIVPHISESDLLRLDINLERSGIEQTFEIKPPDTSEDNVETTVTVPDGSTIILGGMITLDQSKGGSKIPILGDIPLLGGLFRSTNNSDIQSNLYVFVKAEIIRPPNDGLANADLQRISDRYRNAFEKHELEFQKYQDWPGMKPQPMEPLKVLDAQ